MAEDDTTTAPAAVPGVDYGAIIQQIMQGGSGITGPAAPATPAVNTKLPFTGMLGEALGGGVSPLYPMSEAQQTQAGNAALLNFGIGMLQNSSGPVRHSLGQAIASGLLGAQGSLAGVREGQAQMLDVQNKQQTMQLEKIKTLLPLLMRQQAAGMPNPLLGGGLGATGAPIATGSGMAPADMVGSIASTLNIPTADAAAIASNFHAESGLIPGINEIKPAPGTRGGYGLAQWTDTQGSPRRTDLEAYATANKLNVADPATQLAFMKQEIQQKYPNLLPQMAAAKTPEEKAAIFYNTYEGGPPRLLGAHTAMAGPYAALPPPGSVPGGSKTATAPPSATTPTTASTAPPGVQMGGTPPPPPGGSAGPYAGSGIGAALAPPKPDIATSPTLRRGGPATPSAPGQVSANVRAMQAGRDLAQTAPPVTALTAGPGAPTAVATAAPAAPQPGWGSVVGTYGLPGQTPPPTPPTVTPPAQPTPQQPTQADQPPPIGGQTWEQFLTQHMPQPTPEETATWHQAPDPQTLAEAANAKAAAAQALSAARINFGAGSKEETNAQERYQTASKEVGELQRQYSQTNATTLLDWTNKQKTLLAPLFKNQQDQAQAVAEADKQRAAAIALKTQEGQQAIDLANVNAGISTSTKLQEAYNTDAQNSGKRIDDLELLRGLSDNAGTPTLLTNIKIGDRSLADIISTTGFGGKDLQDKVGAVQAFRAGILNTVRELRSGGAATGEPRSNQDLQFVQDMAPNEWQNPATRSAIISFLQQVNQRRIDMAGEISRLTATRGTNGQLMPAGEAVGQARKNLPDFVQTVPAEAMGNTPAQVQARKDWFNTNVPAHTFFRYPNGRIDLYNGPGGQ